MSDKLSELLVSVLDDYLIDQAETMDREAVIARVAALEADNARLRGTFLRLKNWFRVDERVKGAAARKWISLIDKTLITLPERLR